MVRPKAAASAASVMGGPASTMGGERGHGRNAAATTAAEAVRAIKIHTERLNVECVSAACAVVTFLAFMRALAFALDSGRLESVAVFSKSG